MYGRRFALVLLILAACGDNRAAHMQDAGPDGPLPACGDGVPDPGEACDDGNTTGGDGCSADCTSTEVCGNAIVDPGETCDDGNTTSGDGCSSTCGSTEVCGNQIVDVGEDCDTGIAGLSADGCSSWCQLETVQIRELSPATIPLRSRQAMAYDEQRHVTVMFGGLAGPQSLLLWPSDETWEWNGATWTLAQPTMKPPALLDPGMTYDAIRHRIVLFGGESGTSLGGTWEYDGVTWEERMPAHEPPPRAKPLIAFDRARGVTVLVGGVHNGVQLRDTWEWDGVDWTQRTDTPTTSFASPLSYAGGQGVMFCSDSLCAHMFSWDGATWTMQTAAFTHSSLHDSAALVYDPAGGRVLSVSKDTRFGEVSEWDGQAWTLHAISPGPYTGRAVGAFDIDRGVIVLFDGEQTWEWNGSWIFGDTTRSARRLGNVAYDSRRGVTVALDTYLQTTWEWDGKTWIDRAPAHVPPTRDNFALAYDEARGVTVLFGGYTIFNDDPYIEIATDTWEWDGVDWTQRFPQHAPQTWPGFAVTYDSKRKVVLANVGALLWQWDGDDWSVVATGGPYDCSSLSYDIVRDVVVCPRYPATWEWDGATWHSHMTMNPPPSYPGLFYDPVRRTTAVVATGAIWEWDGTDWSATPLSANIRSSYGAYDRRHQQVMFGDGSLRWDPWLYSWTDGKPRELCDGGDADGDGLVGCNDPDCWGSCNPLCIPGTTCDPDDPHCGDGTCSAIESHAICPADCP